jgi:hypothetical protein
LTLRLRWHYWLLVFRVCCVSFSSVRLFMMLTLRVHSYCSHQFLSLRSSTPDSPIQYVQTLTVLQDFACSAVLISLHMLIAFSTRLNYFLLSLLPCSCRPLAQSTYSGAFPRINRYILCTLSAAVSWSAPDVCLVCARSILFPFLGDALLCNGPMICYGPCFRFSFCLCAAPICLSHLLSRLWSSTLCPCFDQRVNKVTCEI